MSRFLQDLFNDPAGTLVSSHVADSGTGWGVVGYNAAYCQIQAVNSRGVACYMATGQELVFNAAVPPSADYRVLVPHYFHNSPSYGGPAGPAVRLDVATGSCYFWAYSALEGYWRLLRLISGTYAELGNTSGGLGLAPNTDCSIELEVTGTNPVHLVARVDGVDVLTYNDNSSERLTGAGRVGMHLFTTNPGYGSMMDDLEAWDVSTGGGGSTAPTIDSIAPADRYAIQDTTQRFVLTGTNLASPTGVTVSGTGVSPTVIGTPTSTSATIDVSTGGTATPGSRALTYTTANGSATTSLAVHDRSGSGGGGGSSINPRASLNSGSRRARILV